MGDYKDGFACVKQPNGFYKHIDTNGKFINDTEFLDLGVFHKTFATAKDKVGWFHIDKNGVAVYSERYLAVEPFYNGFALVTIFDETNDASFANYGLSIYLKYGDIIKCTLHLHDRNINIEYYNNNHF